MVAGDGGENAHQTVVVPSISSADLPRVPALAADSIPTTKSAVATANLEAQALADGNLAAIARQNNHSRRETIRNIVHWVKVAFLLLISGLIVMTIVIVAIHWMTPWGFLTPQQLTTLQTMLGSSVVTGVATSMGRNVLRDLGESR